MADPPNRWRRRMAELATAIAAASTEGDRGVLLDEHEVCRQNANAAEARAERARRLTADVEAES